MLEWVELGVFVGIILVFEIFYQIYLTKEISLGPIKTEHRKFITLNDFKDRVEKKGEKLVILDDYILDVTNFLTVHPGG
jgi:cytochrome b involved in lipid metabolism